jgi:hypothetical protein
VRVRRNRNTFVCASFANAHMAMDVPIAKSGVW